jgi:hypothetical protein
MQLDHDFLKGWERIVNDVEKDHCPIECVKKVIFRTNDRKQKTINLGRLRQQGFDDDSINQAVESFIHQHEDTLLSMEFVLDVERVADIIQPETDRLLDKIK